MQLWKVRTVALLVCLVHAAALSWLVGDIGRRRALFFSNVPVERSALDLPPSRLDRFAYAQDDTYALRRFRARAEAATKGASTDLERITALSNATYALRRAGEPGIQSSEAGSLDRLAAAFDRGGFGQCGHLTWMITGLARSLGIDIRQVTWDTADGRTGHVSFEFYSRDEQRWIYFDVNLNGYAMAEGRALSAIDLRTRTARGAGITLVSNPRHRNWSEEEFARLHDSFNHDWYLMSNEVEVYLPGRRFGRLHAAQPLIFLLPYGGQRLADKLFTGQQTRLAVDGHADRVGGMPVSLLNTLVAYLLAAMLIAAAVLVATFLPPVRATVS